MRQVPRTCTSIERCRTTVCSRLSAASTDSTAMTRTTATSSTTAICSTRSSRPSLTTPAAEAAAIKAEVAHYANVRAEVKIGAGEDVDFKQYEAGMRHLLDTYISAKPSVTIADFEDAGLIELIVRLGASAIDKLPDGI